VHFLRESLHGEFDLGGVLLKDAFQSVNTPSPVPVFIFTIDWLHHIEKAALCHCLADFYHRDKVGEDIGALLQGVLIL
jgi:hypothetical protein